VDQQAAIATVGHAIQLSVAPVFLLSGIGAMLAVLTNRLARVVDAARAVEAQLAAQQAGAAALNPVTLHGNLKTFARRAKMINVAITFCTITAILICAVVAILFIGAFLEFDVSVLIATLFVAGMSTFIVGLLFFLREIFLATVSLRIGTH
jgi:hypothetical protein